MKAIVIQGKGDAQLVADVKEPSLRPSYVKVKVVAVALNPSISSADMSVVLLLIGFLADWKHIDGLPSNGAIVGEVLLSSH